MNANPLEIYNSRNLIDVLDSDLFNTTARIYNSRNLIDVLDSEVKEMTVSIYNSRNLIDVLDLPTILLEQGSTTVEIL